MYNDNPGLIDRMGIIIINLQGTVPWTLWAIILVVHSIYFRLFLRADDECRHRARKIIK